MSTELENIKQALTLLTEHLRKNDFIDQNVEDEVCNLLGYTVESGPEIPELPSGWRKLTDGEDVTTGDYFYHPELLKWVTTGCATEDHGTKYRTSAFHIHITQTINAGRILRFHQNT